MPCDVIISSSCHVFYLLIWYFIPTMTSVKEKTHSTSSVVAMPLSAACLPVLPSTVKKDWQACGCICNTLLTVLKSWRLLLNPYWPSNCAEQKAHQAPSASMHWPIPNSSLFPSSFTVLPTRLCPISVPSNNAHPQSVGQLNYATWECAQLNRHHQMRNDKNSFVLPCLPAFHRLGKINESVILS